MWEKKGFLHGFVLFVIVLFVFSSEFILTKGFLCEHIQQRWVIGDLSILKSLIYILNLLLNLLLKWLELKRNVSYQP